MAYDDWIAEQLSRVPLPTPGVPFDHPLAGLPVLPNPGSVGPIEQIAALLAAIGAPPPTNSAAPALGWVDLIKQIGANAAASAPSPSMFPLPPLPTIGVSAPPWEGLTPIELMAQQVTPQMYADALEAATTLGYSPADAERFARQQVAEAARGVSYGKPLMETAGGKVVADVAQKAWELPGVKKTVTTILDVLSYPQQQVALGIARDMYDYAKYGEATYSSWLPVGPMDWAKDHKQEVIDAYEKGYDIKDDRGKVIGRVDPGRGAVLELYRSSMGEGIGGFLKRMGLDIITDPTIAIPGLGATGIFLRRAGEAVETGSRIRRAAEVGRTAEQVAEDVARGVGKAEDVVPPVSGVTPFDELSTTTPFGPPSVTTPFDELLPPSVVDEGIPPSGVTAFPPIEPNIVVPAGRGAEVVGRTLQRVGTGMETAAHPVNALLQTQAGEAATQLLRKWMPGRGLVDLTQAEQREQLIAQLARGVKQMLIGTKGLDDDLSRSIDDILAEAGLPPAAASLPPEFLPPAAQATPAIPSAPPAAASLPTKLAPPSALPTPPPPIAYPPNAVLPSDPEMTRWLGLNPKRKRSLDIVAFEIGPRNPEAARKFWELYRPGWEKTRKISDDLDELGLEQGWDYPGQREPLGKTEAFVRDYVEYVKPAWEQAFPGEPFPGWEWRNLGPDVDPLFRVNRDANGKIIDDAWKSLGGDVNLNNLIEQAVTNPDELISTDILAALHDSPIKKRQALADRLTVLRRELYGEESVKKTGAEMHREMLAGIGLRQRTISIPTAPSTAREAAKVVDQEALKPLKGQRKKAASLAPPSRVALPSEVTPPVSTPFPSAGPPSPGMTPIGPSSPEMTPFGPPSTTPPVSTPFPRSPLTSETTPFGSPPTTTPFGAPPPARAGLPPSPTPFGPIEPVFWQNEPVRGPQLERHRKEFITIWDDAKARPTLEEGLGTFDDAVEKAFGPRADATYTAQRKAWGRPYGEHIEHYKDSPAGDAWKQVGKEKESFEENWLTHRGGPENPNPDGRLPIFGPNTELVEGLKRAKASLYGDELISARNLGAIDQKTYDILNTAYPTPTSLRGEGVPEQMRAWDALSTLIFHGKSPHDAAKEIADAFMPAATTPVRQRNLFIRLMGDTGSALWSTYKGGTKIYREKQMFGGFSGFRIAGTDVAGNAFTSFTSGRLDVVLQGLNLRRMWRTGKEIARDVDAAIETSPVGKIAEAFELATPMHMVPLTGREETLARGPLTVANFFARKRRLGQAVGKITAPVFGMQAIRNFRVGTENVLRESLWGNTFQGEIPIERLRFFDEVAQYGAKKNVRTRELIDGLGEAFGPSDVLRLGKEAGFDTGQASYLARSWRSHITKMDTFGDREVNRVAFDYARTNLDEALGNVFLFHSWQTRAAPLYLRNAVGNPALANFYYRMTEELGRDCQRDKGHPCGFIELMKTAAGYGLIFKPQSFISTAIIDLDPHWESPDARTIDRILDRAPAMINPILQGMMSGLGISGDPLIEPYLRNERRSLFGVLNYAKSHDWPFVGDKVYTPDFINQWTIKMGVAISEWAAEKGMPFAKRLSGYDSKLGDTASIKADAQRIVAETHGLDPVSSPETWPEQALAELDQSQDEIDLGMPYTGAAAQAYANWSQGNLAKVVTGMGIQGGTMLRSENLDRLRAARKEDNQGAREQLRLIEAGGPRATELYRQEQNVRAATNAGEDSVMRTWVALAFGNSPPGGIYNGIRMDPKDILALSRDERITLADAWAAEVAWRPGLIATGQQKRDAAIEKNPVYKEYKKWADQAHDVGMTTLMETSPNYAAYINDLPDEIANDPQALENVAFSTSAYLVTEGEKPSIYADQPRETFDISRANPVGILSPAAAPTTFTVKSPVDQLLSDIRRYQQDMAFFNLSLQEYTGDNTLTWDQVRNPVMQSTYRYKLGEIGIPVPSEPASLQAYSLWASMQQRLGKPSTLQDYIAWLKGPGKVYTDQGMDPAMAIYLAFQVNAPYVPTATPTSAYPAQ